jgi:hypothetical protein
MGMSRRQLHKCLARVHLHLLQQPSVAQQHRGVLACAGDTSDYYRSIRNLRTRLTRILRTLSEANVATIWPQVEAVQAVLGS